MSVQSSNDLHIICGRLTNPITSTETIKLPFCSRIDEESSSSGEKRTQSASPAKVVTPQLGSHEADKPRRSANVCENRSKSSTSATPSVTGSAGSTGSTGSDSEAMKRASAKKLIERYFYQLVDGCGNPKCNNKYCASSGKVEKLTPNAAAARAIQLFTQEADLCDTHPSKVPKTMASASTSTPAGSSASSSSSMVAEPASVATVSVKDGSSSSGNASAGSSSGSSSGLDDSTVSTEAESAAWRLIAGADLEELNDR